MASGRARPGSTPPVFRRLEYLARSGCRAALILDYLIRTGVADTATIHEEMERLGLIMPRESLKFFLFHANRVGVVRRVGHGVYAPNVSEEEARLIAWLADECRRELAGREEVVWRG